MSKNKLRAPKFCSCEVVGFPEGASCLLEMSRNQRHIPELRSIPIPSAFRTQPLVGRYPWDRTIVLFRKRLIRIDDRGNRLLDLQSFRGHHAVAYVVVRRDRVPT